MKRTATLWEGRFEATLIDSEAYLLTCYRYIELNPVRANMVTHPRTSMIELPQIEGLLFTRYHGAAQKNK